LREAENILAAEQMSQFGQLLGPGEFVENAAQMDEQIDTGCRHQRRSLRV
jgi:hypothetical protein